MTQTPPPEKTQYKSPAPASVKLAAFVLAAATAVAPLTIASEGSFLKAYLDPIRKPTICEGHTLDVHLGQTATKAQCAVFLKEDMVRHMNDIVKMTPALADDQNGLRAAGDFAFNTGAGRWVNSPMAYHFSRHEHVLACNSFEGYMAAATYPKPEPGYQCRPKPGGKWLCNLPGLVTRRLREKKMCLTGSF